MDMIQLEQCINEYGKEIYSFCSQITRNRQEAEDLYQDTFLKALELGEKIDYRRNPKSYFVSIALRIWKNRKRKFAWRKRIAGTVELVEEAVSEESGKEGSAEDIVLEKEWKEEVKKAVDRLDEKYRIPVYLFYTLEFSIGQIGKIMKLPEGTVKSRLHKARKLLKQELEVVLDET
ncbi:MAG: RNA polymerase sigma factor [Lachnospiraceae bacterium]|nr:RNA polymerase sigma factor [Lachnospiraceae bacterium]